MKGLILLCVVASVALGYADDRCPPDQESNWEIEKLLEHQDCNKFYKCTFGKPVEMRCYGDLYFNLETWQCDWRHNVDCGDRNDPAEITTEEPTTTAEPETETTTPEPTTPDPTTPEPTTTETTTPEPTTPEPTPTETTTPEPTTPEPTTPEPTTPEPTTPEPTTPKPTTPKPVPETEAPPVDSEFLENGCPVNPHIHWLLPHEENCNLFYYCVWSEKVLRQCPETLHFNRVLMVCDWPRDAGCATSFDKHVTGRRLMTLDVSSK